jgi:hypothetical protein
MKPDPHTIALPDKALADLRAPVGGEARSLAEGGACTYLITKNVEMNQ